MAYLSKWEKSLLSVLVDQYEEGDFNCGALEEEMRRVKCDKIDGYIINPKCDNCKYRKRFLKLKSKLVR